MTVFRARSGTTREIPVASGGQTEIYLASGNGHTPAAGNDWIELALGEIAGVLLVVVGTELPARTVDLVTLGGAAVALLVGVAVVVVRRHRGGVLERRQG